LETLSIVIPAYAEGKKINWKDGVRAIWRILKYR
jgi:hypothetical protein